MRILFITSNRLGDAVLSTGLLDHLIRTDPRAAITVVCGPVAEGLFEHMPNRERTIVMTKQSYGRHWLRLWAETAMHRWDLVVDIRGSALSWLVPARERSVFRAGSGPKVAQLAALLNLSPPPNPVVWTSEADRRHVRAMLPTDKPVVVLGPTANWEPKTWPADRFAAFFRQLNLPGAVPVVVGGPGPFEAKLAAPVLQMLPEAIDMVGRLTLSQVVALMQLATLFIGNDSGLMHMAAAAGTPTIGLFGPTDAETYGPTGPRAIKVAAPSMRELELGTVLNAARRLLAGELP